MPNPREESLSAAPDAGGGRSRANGEAKEEECDDATDNPRVPASSVFERGNVAINDAAPAVLEPTTFVTEGTTSLSPPPTKPPVASQSLPEPSSFATDGYGEFTMYAPPPTKPPVPSQSLPERPPIVTERERGGRGVSADPSRRYPLPASRGAGGAATAKGGGGKRRPGGPRATKPGAVPFAPIPASASDGVARGAPLPPARARSGVGADEEAIERDARRLAAAGPGTAAASSTVVGGGKKARAGPRAHRPGAVAATDANDVEAPPPPPPLSAARSGVAAHEESIERDARRGGAAAGRDRKARAGARAERPGAVAATDDDGGSLASGGKRAAAAVGVGAAAGVAAGAAAAGAASAPPSADSGAAAKAAALPPGSAAASGHRAAVERRKALEAAVASSGPTAGNAAVARQASAASGEEEDDRKAPSKGVEGEGPPVPSGLELSDDQEEPDLTPEMHRLEDETSGAAVEKKPKPTMDLGAEEPPAPPEEEEPIDEDDPNFIPVAKPVDPEEDRYRGHDDEVENEDVARVMRDEEARQRILGENIVVGVEVDQDGFKDETGADGRSWIQRNRCLAGVLLLALVGAVVGIIVGVTSSSGSGTSDPAPSPTVVEPTGTKVPTAVPTLAPSDFPTTIKWYTIYQAVLPISNANALQQSGTPQNKALTWLAKTDGLVIDMADTEKLQQRFSVVTLFYSTGGDAWSRKLNFLTDLEVCSWSDDEGGNETLLGVTTCTDAKPSTLLIGDNNLVGSIPPEIGALTNLIRLDLSGPGQLDGSLPASIGNLVDLSRLYVQNNQIANQIPASFWNLTNLVEVNLSQNEISGEVPASIGNLVSVTTLDLAINKFKGEFPVEALGMKLLDVLRLNGNDFTGDMSFMCTNLSLTESQVDCLGTDFPPTPAQVMCTCCTSCCNEGTECRSD